MAATISAPSLPVAPEVKPGDYVGLYLDGHLVHTGVLKDVGVMASGRKIYQVLLVKNMFQRNFPELHFDLDIRPVSLDEVKAEIRRMKIRLQKSIELMETNTDALVAKEELNNIVG